MGPTQDVTPPPGVNPTRGFRSVKLTEFITTTRRLQATNGHIINMALRLELTRTRPCRRLNEPPPPLPEEGATFEEAPNLLQKLCSCWGRPSCCWDEVVSELDWNDARFMLFCCDKDLFFVRKKPLA